MTQFITRTDWGARPPKSAPVHFSTVNYVVAHHTTGATLGADRSAQWVRNIQNFHMDSNGWADIGYSFLYDSYGNIFEGRGWGVVGAHTLNYNSQGHGFAFLGDGTQEISEAALDAVRWLVAESDRRYGPKTIRGHREVFGTECPGNWIEAHLGDFRGGNPAPSPGPVVLGSPPPQTGDDMYSVEVMVTQMPVLQRGATGQYVGLLECMLVANGRRALLAHSFNDKGDPDKGFGPEVENALKDFQRATGRLNDDGVAGEKTWRALLCI